MTENAGETPGNPTGDAGETPADPATNTPPAQAGESVEGLKAALTQERQARKGLDKELRDIRTQLTQFQDRDKTDLEKATSRAETAESRLAEFERRDLARTIAADAGIPDLWEALHGDEDRMRDLAKRLAEKVGTAATLNPSDLGAGVRGGSDGLTGSRAMTAQIRKAAGRR